MLNELTGKDSLHVLSVGQDSPYFQSLNSKLSSDHGFQIQSVRTFSETAPSLDQGRRYDAILLDLDIPVEDRFTNIRKIHEKNPFMPVIALGEDENPAVGLQVISEGGDDYLVKGRIHSGVVDRVVRYGIEKKRQDKRNYFMEQKYRLITERSATAICVIGTQETVSYINPAAEVLCGISAANARGKAVRDILHFQDWPAVAAFLAASAGTTRILDAVLYENGERLPVILNLSSFRLEGEDDIFLFIDRKVMPTPEEREQTRKVTQEARQGELDRIQSEYVSAVSHYLKTPLASIRLYLDYLVNGYAGSVTEKQKEYLSTIDETTERLNDQVTRLLNLSKIRSHQFQMKMEQTDLAHMLEEESRIFKAQAEHKPLEMVIKTEKAPLVYCDRGRMREVINNFISNAVKYTPAGGRVAFFARRAVNGVELVFEDTGIGIEAQYLEAIFDPFCDIPKTGIGWVESTGLGLSLAKRVVEMHQGTVSVKSQKGKGSIFTVFLPVEKRKANSRRNGV